MEEQKIKIKAFLARSFRNYDLQDDEDIFSLGFVNSLFAMELVMFLEKEFQVTIEDEDLELENFRTIQAMTNLITQKNAHLNPKFE